MTLTADLRDLRKFSTAVVSPLARRPGHGRLRRRLAARGWAAVREPPRRGADRRRRQAKRDGNCEGRDAYAADALLRLAAGAGQGKAQRADLVIVCDLHAYRRGHAHPGEPFHIVGGGPIPVSLIRELSEDAFIKAVLHDGTRIDTVVHYSRHIKTELRTALELGAVPDFDGVTCTEAECDRRYHLEWDHVDPSANWGPTSYENLKPRCYPHHQEKTARDRKAGLLMGRGHGPDPP